MTDKRFVENACMEYGEMVYRLALARTGNPSDAEDIFQEVFLRLFRHGEKVQGYLKPWLLRCTVNRCKSLAMSPWRKRRAELTEVPELPEEESEVWQAVQALPPKYRIPVHLHYGEGLAVKEIAAALGCAEGTVRSRLSRARKMLSGIMKGENDA